MALSSATFYYMSHTEKPRTAANDAEAMTADEAAKRLQMNADTLVKKCRALQWPHHRLGRAYRFTEGDIAAILALTAVTPAKKAKAEQSWGRRGRSA